MAQYRKSLYTQNRLFEVQRGDNKLCSVCYLSGGKFIASGGYDKTISIIDSSNGDVVHEKDFGDYIETILAVRPKNDNPNDEWLMVGGGEKEGRGSLKMYQISIIDDTNFSLLNMNGIDLESKVSTVSVHPNSNNMAVGCEDGTLQMYNVTQSSLTATNNVKGDDEICVTCFSPNGSHLVAGDDSDKFVVYNATTLEELHTETTANTWMQTMCFSPDGMYLAVAGWIGKIVVYKVTSLYSKMNEIETDYGQINSLVYSPNGRYIVAAGDSTAMGGSAILYDAFTLIPQRQIKFSETVFSAAFSPNGGEQLATAGEDKKVTVFAMSDIKKSDTQELWKAEEDGDSIYHCACSPDASTVALAREDGKLAIFHILTKTTTHHDIDGTNPCNISFNWSGTELAIGDEKGAIRIYNAETMEKIDELSHRRVGWIAGIAYSPDAKFLCAGGNDKKLVIYNRSTWEEVNSFKRDNYVRASAYSSDGRFLAIGGYDMKVTIHDCKGNMKQIYEKKFDSIVMALSFSPDSKLLAVGKRNNVRVSPKGIGQVSFLDSENGFDHFTKPCLFDDGVRGLSFAQTRMDDKDYCDHHTLAVLKGTTTVLQLKVHKHLNMQPDQLLKFWDESIIQYVHDHPISAHHHNNDGKTVLSLAIEKDRVQLVQDLLQNDSSIALIPNVSESEHQQQNIISPECPNGYLHFLQTHHHIDDIKTFLKREFTTLVSHAILHEMVEVLHKFTESEDTESVLHILDAGQDQSSMKGYVKVCEDYRKVPPKSFGFPLLDLMQKLIFINPSQLPLASRLPPRTSSIPTDFATWSDIEKDEEKRVKCNIVRVLLPGLTSLRSLQKLTGMSSLKIFNSKSLCESIDASWETSFKYIFYKHALIYIIFIVVPFTFFCENVRMTQATDYGWQVYLPMAIVFIGLLYFAGMEVRSMKTLGPKHYWSDLWNLVQWIAKLLILMTSYLAISKEVEDAEVIAIMSSITIMMTYIGIFFYLRGLEGTAWIVIALYNITVKAKSFLLVMALVVLTFAMGFHFLDNITLSSVSNLDDDDDAPRYFHSIETSLQTSVLALTGEFGFVDEEYSYSDLLKKFQSFLLYVLILIIALNALIAFIGDSFDRVLGQKAAVLKRQRAKMMIEIYSFLSETRQQEIEEENRWVTSIVAAASLDVEEENELENFRKANKDDVETLRKEMKKEMKGVKEGVESKIDRAKSELKEEMKKEIEGIKKEIEIKIDGVKEDMEDMKKDINEMKKNMEKILSILKS